MILSIEALKNVIISSPRIWKPHFLVFFVLKNILCLKFTVVKPVIISSVIPPVLTT